MCSIAGIVGKGDIQKMLAVQRHRAPDDSNFYEDRHLKLAMGRLKIIDLKSPGLCLYQEGDLVLSYNGEIYNYLELKEELQKSGLKFKTNSDTEVLLKSFCQWGYRAFDKLNGMYAFALYDKKRKTILLARDIAGEKPLYYYQKGQAFAFASEAKALSHIFPVTIQENNLFYKAFEHCHIDTLWEEIKEIPPAHYLLYRIKDNKLTIKPHWQFTPRSVKLKNAEEELETLLADAVKIRTRSDVPYALYYSGGIDSSLIDTFHNFQHKFYFDNKADWKSDFFTKIERVVWHLDTPVGSLSSYPLWKLAEEASQKVKVVISGEGADEVFGGYVRYLPIAREYELRKKFPSYNAYLFPKYFKFTDYLEAFASITSRNPKHISVTREMIAPYFKMFNDPINAMGFADFKLILPSLLQMGDRMAGAFGIENRCPFLDRRLIEFGFSLPPQCKISGLRQKLILRKILARRGSHDALDREKEGLTVFFNKWSGKKIIWDRSLYFAFVKDIWYKTYNQIRK